MAIKQLNELIQFSPGASKVWNGVEAAVPDGVWVLDTDTMKLYQGNGTDLIGDLSPFWDIGGGEAAAGKMGLPSNISGSGNSLIVVNTTFDAFLASTVTTDELIDAPTMANYLATLSVKDHDHPDRYLTAEEVRNRILGKTGLSQKNVNLLNALFLDSMMAMDQLSGVLPDGYADEFENDDQIDAASTATYDGISDRVIVDEDIFITKPVLATSDITKAKAVIRYDSLDVDAIDHLKLELTRDGSNFSIAELELNPMAIGSNKYIAANCNFNTIATNTDLALNNITLPDSLTEVTNIIVDTANSSGHFNVVADPNWLGQKFSTLDGDVVVTNIIGDGTGENSVDFSGTLDTGTYNVTRIDRLEYADGEITHVFADHLNLNSIYATMPFGRDDMAIVKDGDNVILIGGSTEWYAATDTVNQYDTTNDSWKELRAMPILVAGAKAILRQRKIWLFGGFDLSGHVNPWLLTYDLDRNVWEKKKFSLTQARGHMVFAYLSAQDRIVTHGGFDGTNYLLDTWELNPNTLEWVSKSDGAVARAYAAQAVIDDKLYVLGGYNGSVAVSNNAQFNNTENTWYVKQDLPTTITQGMGLVDDTNVIIFGGTRTAELGQHLYVYNTIDNTFDIKGLEAFSASGLATLLNHNFATDTTGIYTAVDTTISYESGCMRATYTGTDPEKGITISGGNAIFAVNDIVHVKFKAKGTRTTAFLSIGNLTDLSNSIVIKNPVISAVNQTYEIVFKANSDIMRFYLASGAAGEYVEFDDIEITKLDVTDAPTLTNTVGSIHANTIRTYFGKLNGTTRQAISSFTLDTETYTESVAEVLPTGPTASVRTSIETVNDVIYVIGGNYDNGEYSNELWAWDMNNPGWEPKAALPEKLSRGISFSYKTDLYYIGAVKSTGYTTLNLKYDTIDNTWTRLKDIPFTQNDSDGVVVDEHFYCGNGLDTEFWRYTPATDVWLQLADSPNVVCDGEISHHEGKIYELFGKTNYHPTAYTIATDTWDEITDSEKNDLKLRTGNGTFINGKYYHIGGISKYSQNATNDLTNPYMVDSDSDGVADTYSMSAGYDATPSVVTGNGFNGYAQRVENGSGADKDTLQLDSFTPTTTTYHLSGKYRSSTYLKIQAPLGNLAYDLILPPNVDDAKFFEFNITCLTTNPLAFFTNVANEWYEVGELSIKTTPVTNAAVMQIYDPALDGLVNRPELILTNSKFDTWLDDDPVDYTITNEDANNYVTEHASGMQIVSDNSAVLAIQRTVSVTEGDKLRWDIVTTEHNNGSVRVQVQDSTNSANIIPIHNIPDSTTADTRTIEFIVPPNCTEINLYQYSDTSGLTDYVVSSWSLRKLQAWSVLELPDFKYRQQAMTVWNNQMICFGGTGLEDQTIYDLKGFSPIIMNTQESILTIDAPYDKLEHLKMSGYKLDHVKVIIQETSTSYYTYPNGDRRMVVKYDGDWKYLDKNGVYVIVTDKETALIEASKVPAHQWYVDAYHLIRAYGKSIWKLILIVDDDLGTKISNINLTSLDTSGNLPDGQALQMRITGLASEPVNINGYTLGWSTD